jgi:DGQHR domain-containing protein
MNKTLSVPGVQLNSEPPIYLAIIKGRWLLEHTTPVWRIKDPERGFQRIAKDQRVKQIAAAVLDHKRGFPNAIILATDKKDLAINGCDISLSSNIKFLVVDGQHRLWAQKFSKYEAAYACVIHCALDEIGMAKLFLEINDNQKRVPSSLRWDLVRLVRPKDDHSAIVAVELVYELSNSEDSPLYRRIDLTGELPSPENFVNQGSLAPEIKNIVSKKGLFKEADFDLQVKTLTIYLTAIKNSDSTGWQKGTSPFYKTRVLRVLIRLLPEIIEHLKVKHLEDLEVNAFLLYLNKIKRESLSDDVIRAQQGAAGMKAIYDQIKGQII